MRTRVLLLFLKINLIYILDNIDSIILDNIDSFKYICMY